MATVTSAWFISSRISRLSAIELLCLVVVNGSKQTLEPLQTVLQVIKRCVTSPLGLSERITSGHKFNWNHSEQGFS